MPVGAPRDRRSFEIALICALPLEAEWVQEVFDKFWEDEGKKYGRAPGDPNVYTPGVIGEHNVVLAYMPGIGITSAAALTGSLRVSFPNIKLALVVGICGGMPFGTNQEEIVLGDVIISQALIPYDFGRQYPEGFRRKTDVRDTLGRPSSEIRAIQAKLGTNRYKQRMQINIARFLEDILQKLPKTKYPGQKNDILYRSSYVHQHHSPATCGQCGKNNEICEVALKTECEDLGCESIISVTRNRLIDTSTTQPVVHFGIMGSGNTVMKSGQHRDYLAQADGIIGFEMEGAGVWDYFPSIIIKGVCDYADSHKRKGWQRYAAATAAACTKAFLVEWSVEGIGTGSDELSDSIWHVPFNYIPGFVGRTEELKHLRQRIFDSDGRRIMSLLGLGGIGKSRLAIELVYQVKSEYPHWSILWIQAADQLTFEKDVLDVGKKLRIPGIEDDQADAKTLVKQRLSNSSADRWLLVLDNADDEAVWGKRLNANDQQSTLVDWLPRTMHGSILITTRSRRVANYLAGKEVTELHAISANEASEMFLNALERPETAADQSAMKALLDKLTYLPLAIVQAASYINMTQETVNTYLDLMDEPEEEVIKLLSEDFGDQTRYSGAHNPVATTWLISFEQIRQYHPLAARLLSAMACLHEKNIPHSLLPEIGSKKDVVDAIGTLKGYSFTLGQTGDLGNNNLKTLYNVHRLVHLAARNWLKMKGALPDSTKACIIRVAQLFPSANKSTWTMYLPHAQRLCEDRSVGDIPERYLLLENMGLCFMADGKYHEAVKAHTTVVAWREHNLGSSDNQTIKAYHNLGDALSWHGKLSSAERYLQKAVEGRVSKLGKSHPSTLASMSNLACVLSHQGNYSEAETMHREALQLLETVLGKSHPDTLASMVHLACVLSHQGNYSEAETMHREALQLLETVLGKSHPDTLASMNNLASVLSHQGNYSEAETMHREALQLKETVLGKSHPSTLTSINNLAEVLSGQGNYSEAETMHREALQLSETVLGKSHPDTLTSMNNLALTWKQQGRNAEAVTLMEECVQLGSPTIGVNHPNILWSSRALAEWKAEDTQIASGLE